MPLDTSGGSAMADLAVQFATVDSQGSYLPDIQKFTSGYADPPP